MFLFDQVTDAAFSLAALRHEDYLRHTITTRSVTMLKFLASTAGVIFLIGLLVVIGLLMLIF
ncbi:hypothetical protein [Billgrantia kenyensis]|uniref:Uncharacterized protein n=1 Tax=Billgrantia kenyensis TaxID=321266 RepID=A0A7W0ABS3_9GAMM|nr:hypothetical protein [Halomonas kenyensis]MBA2777441.1 hypothetical protein [Halomonas kenyensis]MCG6660111.1 hypothetical protein [Halomonas kenyensis]